MNEPVRKIALIGAGQRGMHYIQHIGDQAELVAVADPNPVRRNQVRDRFQLAESSCYEDWQTLLAEKKVADAVLICTQDQAHYAPTMQALEAGYHVMLEKPMSTDPLECHRMVEAAKRMGRMLVICHVLRYTPFFRTIKHLLDEGEIGRLVTISHHENVGYWHQAHSYVRGNWRKAAEASPMILSKSSHDLDILHWLADAECLHLSSFGSLTYFNSDNAPQGAPARCLDGCPASEHCEYYAPRIYLTDDTNWPTSAISDDLSYAGRLRALEEGPYGRCVYHCDNDVVDHQVVNMEFANTVTAVFTMSAFTQQSSRTIKLMGTKGEIRAAMEKDEIELRHFSDGTVRTIAVSKTAGHAGHGGGDSGLMLDFVSLLAQDGASSSQTSADRSLHSHLLAFAAEESRLHRQTIRMDNYLASLDMQAN